MLPSRQRKRASSFRRQYAQAPLLLAVSPALHLTCGVRALRVKLVDELDRVFEQLQGIAVDPSMVSGEQGKTLFDFVDAETVHSLQQDAVEQLNESVSSFL